MLSTGKKDEGSKTAGAGHIRGPLQITFARSQDPILPSDHAITRVTPTRQEDLTAGKQTEMGSKWTVSYGLYRAHAYYSAPRAAKTGVTSDGAALASSVAEVRMFVSQWETNIGRRWRG